MTRRFTHAHADETRPPSSASQLVGTMFDGGTLPDIRTPAPAAPGSVTSAAAARAIDGPFRQQSHRSILLVLGAASGWRSRATPAPINVVCARIPELEPLWIAREKGICRSHAKPALRVDGFRITPAGRDRLTADMRARSGPSVASRETA